MYRCFVRNWWRIESDPNSMDFGLRVPHAGRKTVFRKYVETEEEALQICKGYNKSHAPGRLSRKAEFEKM